MARPKTRYNRYKHSGLQLKYRRDAIRMLESSSATVSLASKIERCGLVHSVSGARKVVFRCGSLFCPDCRRHATSARSRAAQIRFSSFSREEIYFVTLLFPTRHSLFLAIDGVNTASGVINACKRQAARVQPESIEDIRRIKDSIGKMLDRAKLDRLQQFGWIEFTTKTPTTMPPPARKFIEESQRKYWHSLSEDPAEVITAHAHFLFAAERQGRALDAAEIGRLFRSVFTLPNQVYVKPLYPSQSRPVAIKKLVGYSMKTFLVEQPHRLQEIALFHELAGKQILKFDRYRTSAAYRHRLRESVRRFAGKSIQHIRAAWKDRESIPGLIPWDHE